MAAPIPHILYGRFTDKNGNVVAGATITAKNLATNATITVTTDANGDYVLDCANFSGGYVNGDTIKLLGASSASINFEIYFSVDGGNNWMEVNNNEETNLSANTVRKKVDTINYPGGIADLDIRLIV